MKISSNKKIIMLKFFISQVMDLAFLLNVIKKKRSINDCCDLGKVIKICIPN